METHLSEINKQTRRHSRCYGIKLFVDYSQMSRVSLTNRVLKEV